jgi:hypothetical protein
MKPRSAQSRILSGDGQILVLAALLMVILIGITGLAIDASAAYVADRWQRSVADAAALAGGQDLQLPGSVAAPGAPQQNTARGHAMDVLVSELGATSTPSTAVGSPCLGPAGCPLPGTPYIVAIRTPTPSFVDCTPLRCIQVSVRQPSFGLTFGRIFGQNNWSVNTASVAGVVQAHQYGVVTLRAPKPRSNGTDANEDDIKITGGSQVHVGLADVATNTNMIYSGTNSLLDLGPDYRVNFYDINQAWSGAPPGNRVTSLVPDPQYPIPTRITGTTPVFTTQAAGQDTGAGCYDPVTGEQAKVPLEYKRRDGTSIQNMPAAKVICQKPGVYLRPIVNSDHDAAIILEPGVYFLDAGMDNSSTIIGGYVGGQPGVALVFLEAKNQNGSVPGQLTANSSDLLALNMGSQYLNPAGTRAIRADGPQGPVQTSGPQPILMTLIVVPDAACLPIVSPPQTACDESFNKTLQLPGGGELFVVGVQYAPTDNVFVKGNSTSTGTLGQVISWTIEFNSSFLNLEAAVTDATGVLRLDLACSPTVNVCNP